MRILQFAIELQECSEWCWAAVTAAVCKCYGDPAPAKQCEVANLVLQLSTDNCTDCNCEHDPSAACNQPQNLASVLSLLNHDRGNPPDGLAILQFDDVKSDIDDGHPVVVEITLDDPAASGHAIAIYGYTDDGIVSIADPMHPDDTISVSFDDFVAGNQTGLHGKWKAAYRTKGANE